VPRLPRPDLAAGAHRDLVRELHELHHRAGWPSLRALSAAAGCSPTTVSSAFSEPRLPRWGLLELLVEAMSGDVDRFHALWLAAGSPEPSPARTAVVGRRDEIDALRRHARSEGLLLVEGEPGIGKSALVARAVAELRTEQGVVVGKGHALPLSGHEPLLPLTDALGEMLELAPAVVTRSLESVPGYVVDELGRVAPGLVASLSRSPSSARDPQQMQGGALLPALHTFLSRLAAGAQVVLVLEDLHWADRGTLEALDYLVARRTPVSLVATWRLDDREVAAVNEDWRRRMAHQHHAGILELGPLSRAETAEHVALLTGVGPTAEEVDRVFRRSRGQPLFTEQLVSQGHSQEWPAALGDLLERRLGDLDGAAWRLVLTLSVAERSLSEQVVREAANLDVDEFAENVRRLRDRRLVAPSLSGEVAMCHPLLAETAQRRATTGERRGAHRALALALADQADPSSAEIAEHWAGAGEPTPELEWRLRAAEAAQKRLAMCEAAAQWHRALDLWPTGSGAAADPRLRRGRVIVAAMDALPASDAEQALDLAADGEEHLAELTIDEVALLYQRKGDLLAGVGRSDEASGYLQWALRLYDTMPPSAEHVDALERYEGLLGGRGRRHDAAGVATTALDMARRIGDARRTRHLLGLVAWHLAAAGDAAGAHARVQEAMALDVGEPDPFGDIELAADVTDLLLRTGAPASQVLDAGVGALQGADRWGLSTFGTSLVRANLGIALLRAGRTAAALEMVTPETSGLPDPDSWVAHLVRATVETTEGAFGAARQRLDLLGGLPAHSLAVDAELVAATCQVALWEQRPHDAWRMSTGALDERTGTEDMDSIWLLLVTAARAAADVGPPEVDAIEQLHRIATGAHGGTDAAIPALRATVTAELSRARRADAVEPWVAVAGHWDRLRRPHDAAYARWRAAQCAVASGRPDAAQRLIRRATRDAREHEPLLHELRQVSQPPTEV
jgi:tetratricopeptide (TPR) repeat protein